MFARTTDAFVLALIAGGVRSRVWAQGDARSASDEAVEGAARNTPSSTGAVSYLAALLLAPVGQSHLEALALQFAETLEKIEVKKKWLAFVQ